MGAVPSNRWYGRQLEACNRWDCRTDGLAQLRCFPSVPCHVRPYTVRMADDTMS